MGDECKEGVRMKIDNRKLVEYLMEILDLQKKLEETQKELVESKADAMNWYKKWKALKEKYEKEEG